MAVLQKMRDKFGVLISVIIALSLLYFIAPMDDLMTLFGKPQNVGEINGKVIAYEDYTAQVDKFTTVHQIMTGSSTQSEDQQRQIRDAAWQELLDKYLFISKAQAAGIKVTDSRMHDLIYGEKVSPVLDGNPIFSGEDGKFSKAALRTFLNEMEQDESGRLKTYWEFILQSIRSQAYAAGYNAAFISSDNLNNLQKEWEMAMNNTTATVDYFVKPFGFVKDTTVTVSDAEISQYYKAHRKFFKQNASRDIEYVIFEVTPSASDIAGTKAEMDAVYPEFCSTDNMKKFLLSHSDVPYSEYWYKKGEFGRIAPQMEEFASSAQVGSVSGIIESGDKFFAGRVMASAMVPDSVYVRHILLQGSNASARADSLLDVLKKGGNFSQLAEKFTVDGGSKDGGVLGNIGWLTQNYMIPGFGSVITAKAGVPYKLQTVYGTHVVEVVKTTRPIAKKQMAVLEKAILSSKETFNEYYAKANHFATLAAGSLEGYRKAVDSTGVYSRAMNLTEDTENIGGVPQAKEITRWVFEHKAGKASEILTVNQKYFFVAAVTKVNKEGFTPLDDVREQISNVLYNKARDAKAVGEMDALLQEAGSLEAAASKLGLEVRTGKEVSFSTMGGGEFAPAVQGNIYICPVGEVGKSAAAPDGVYAFKVTGRDSGSFYTDSDAESMQSRKASYAFNGILSVMSESAGVKDNRARFF